MGGWGSLPALGIFMKIKAAFTGCKQVRHTFTFMSKMLILLQISQYAVNGVIFKSDYLNNVRLKN